MNSNMREIKFRAWDKKTKSFEYFELIDFSSAWYDEEMVEKIAGSDILQYTGLKDKNGVDVYEGDYLRSELDRYRVEWTKSKCAFELFNLTSYGYLPCSEEMMTEMKVVGNIYVRESRVAEMKHQHNYYRRLEKDMNISALPQTVFPELNSVQIAALREYFKKIELEARIDELKLIQLLRETETSVGAALSIRICELENQLANKDNGRK